MNPDWPDRESTNQPGPDLRAFRDLHASDLRAWLSNTIMPDTGATTGVRGPARPDDCALGVRGLASRSRRPEPASAGQAQAARQAGLHTLYGWLLSYRPGPEPEPEAGP